mgnify:CR=1 FL=1|jgi:hypothetical protein
MATRKSTSKSRSKNPSSKSKSRRSNPSTGGTKKGGVRKTARRAYMKNPPGVLGNPALQAALGGALAVGVDKAAGMLGGPVSPMISAGIKAIAGIALGNKKVMQGKYSAAGGAMIGIAAYQLVSGFGAGTQGIAAAPYGAPWTGSSPTTGGLAYDPAGAETLNYGNVVNQYA